jgi:fructokinase
MSFMDLLKRQAKGEVSTHDHAPHCVGLGEILWDIYVTDDPSIPSVRHLGGSPLNFAYHAHQLGANAEIISCIGKDPSGDALLKQVTQHGLTTRNLQRCPYFPTGGVTIHQHEDRESDYTIHSGVAWDVIDPTAEAISLLQHAEIINFGTLAQRCEKSRATILSLLGKANEKALKVFDVNIREQYYTSQTIMESLRLCQVLKMSDEDLPRLAHSLSLPERHPQLVARLFEHYPMNVIAITMGADGSEIFTRETNHFLHAEEITVVDPTGAGDAFTAALALGWYRHMPLEEIHAIAVEVAAYVCTRLGSNPPMPPKFRKRMGL